MKGFGGYSVVHVNDHAQQYSTTAEQHYSCTALASAVETTRRQKAKKKDASLETQLEALKEGACFEGDRSSKRRAELVRDPKLQQICF